MTPIEILKEVKSAIRNKYAWPGGYPLFIILADGEALSCDAARENWRQIISATISGNVLPYDSWRAAGVEINWENTNLFCVHSGARIESAYGENE